MKCCPQCIGDRHLARQVFPNLTTERATCPCCSSENQPLIAPQELKDAFELLTGIYVRDRNGRPLVTWLKDDWALFEHPRMDPAHAKELLAEILDDGEIVRQRFVPSSRCHSDAVNRWQHFRAELMHKNRFFPQPGLDLGRLRELLPHLLLSDTDLPSVWYRARIQDGDESFPPAEMGAPPEKRASFGRANPAGIPYLYLASDSTTAISEVRPHAGETASVADFSISANLKIVDLGDPRRTVSPFVLADENEVALLRGDISLLEQLGAELTRPVLPQAAAIDFTPTQYLCEFIKNCSFDGVMYQSAVGDGVNIALFDPAKAEVGSVTSYRVSRVSVEIDGGPRLDSVARGERGGIAP